MRVYSIKDPIYKELYKVFIGDDCQELVTRSGVNMNKPFNGLTGEADGFTAICFLENDERITTNFNTIVHEAQHAMQFTFTARGVSIEVDNHEHVAYYVAWLADELLKIVLKHDKHRKTSNTE